MGKGFVWNFFCAFIGSSVYDSSGSGIIKVTFLVSAIKVSPDCGLHFVLFLFFFGGGWHRKIYKHTNVLLRPIYFNTLEEHR